MITVHIEETKDGTIAISVHRPEGAPSSVKVARVWELLEPALRAEFKPVKTHFVPVKKAKKARRL